MTHIDPPLTVFSERGRQVEMKDRKSYGLSLCISGQITYTHQGRQYVSTPDNALLLPKGATYRLYGNRQGSFPVLNFDCLGVPWEELRIIPLRDAADCLRRFHTIQELFVKGGDQTAIFSAAYSLLHAVLASPAATAPIAAAQSLIEQHLGETALDNAFLADRLGVSEVYLRKLFAKHLGTSPKQYILSRRITLACRLLSESALSVTQVALESGFSGPYHFCRAFKARTGETPTEYAKTHKIYKI